jgi:hypothetical protein
MNYSCHLFVGPSKFGVDLPAWEAEDIIWHPPAKRGDIERLIADEPIGNIAIADGTFHRFPAVGHIEIRNALDAGWKVWGLCSMGAIRASEMAELGMQGFGSVYEIFHNNKSFPDDEVAVLHSAEPPYFSISEPLLHLRFYVHYLSTASILLEDEATSLVEWLQNRWYGERSIKSALSWIKEHRGAEAENRAKKAAELFDFRLKQHDLKAFLKIAPWRKNGIEKYTR